MSLSGQRILVTGASSGLGRALTVKLAESGATVLATARREDRLLDLAKAYATVEPHALDVTDTNAVDAFIAKAGRLDGAVLNAGITQTGKFSDGSVESDIALVETNITANLRLSRGLQASLSGGRLVLVGSMAGFVPLPYQAVYSGTKAFVQNFGLALREEWRGDISVGVFAPGGIATEMTDGKDFAHLDKHLADVDAVADALLRFYGSGKAMTVPGAGNRATATLSRVLPRPWLARLMERVYRG